MTLAPDHSRSVELFAAPRAAKSGNQTKQVDQATAVKGGQSPDGRFEIRMLRTSDRTPSNYIYQVFDREVGTAIKTLEEGGGIYEYPEAAKMAAVAWHGGSRVFALTDSGTRRSSELYLYEIRGEQVARLAVPDYQQNALGRVSAVAVYRESITDLQRWDGDLLMSELRFDARVATRDGRVGTYRVTFALRLWRGPNTETFVTLESMSTPSRREPQ